MRLLLGESLDVLKTLESNSVDSIVTDPPAGIGFMNKSWDKAKSRDEWIQWLKEIMIESKRVLKPGGHALVWALPRTSHWTATALEDAGFEIRDTVNHIFGTGFPKSQNIGKAVEKIKEEYRISASLIQQSTENEWEGWGSNLKPAHEHWILCRKPIEEKTIAENVVKWGCGGLNIDACRVGNDTSRGDRYHGKPAGTEDNQYFQGLNSKSLWKVPTGRWPANLILSHHQECEEKCHDECVVSEMDEHSGKLSFHDYKYANKNESTGSDIFGFPKGSSVYGYADEGGASRFFYCSKASRKDRGSDNTHPTVKNTKLMEYLIKLITPPNGTVLDPFAGSGSTLVAAKRLGFKFIGIEKEREYFEIAGRRIGE